MPKILVAEDDACDQLLLKHAFEKAAPEVAVHFVRDGQETIDYLEEYALGKQCTPATVPQLLLLDLKMPRVNGFEVLEWVRSQPRLRRLSVVVLSSSNDPRDFQEATELGACDYRVKPHDPGELVALLKGLEHYWAGPLAGAPTARSSDPLYRP